MASSPHTIACIGSKASDMQSMMNIIYGSDDQMLKLVVVDEKVRWGGKVEEGS